MTRLQPKYATWLLAMTIATMRNTVLLSHTPSARPEDTEEIGTLMVILLSLPAETTTASASGRTAGS